MSLIHSVVSHAKGGVRGLQANQRDWSPFVVHFTSYAAMAPIRTAVPAGKTPSQVAALLDTADANSFAVLEAIAGSALLRASIPEGKDESDPCVCLARSPQARLRDASMISQTCIVQRDTDNSRTSLTNGSGGCSKTYVSRRSHQSS